MSDTPPHIKQQHADQRHEQFYQTMVNAMLTLHLRDEEGVAIMGRLLGYHRATNPDASSVPHLVSVLRFNIREAERAFRAGEIPERPTGTIP